MAQAVRAEERLFSLVLTLLASESGLTKSQIFATVRGYEPDSNGGASSEALEKKFDRDKTELRELGVPIETFDSPDAPGDNQHIRYRIPKDEYDFPTDITFTGAELALLNLAGEVWREGTISESSHRALTKLRSFDIEPDAPILGYVPRIRTREVVFDRLSQAIERNERVLFEYAKPGEAKATVRDVTPFSLGLVDGRWHLLGFDHARDAERTFLLSRIQGGFRVSADEAVTIPASAPIDLVDGLKRVLERNRARVRASAGTSSATQLLNHELTEIVQTEREWLTLDVHFLDETVFASELAAGGPEVIALEPASLRTAVQSILREASSVNGGIQ